MNIIEAIYNRRSSRHFCVDKEVSKDVIKLILNAGIQAPSGKNGQPWKFAIVQNKSTILKLSGLSINKKTIMNASCLVFVYLDKEKSYDYQKDILAIGACIQNILLASLEYGVATCWNADILRNKERVNKIINISSNCELMSMIILGYQCLDNMVHVPKTKRISINEKIHIWIEDNHEI